MVFTVGLTGGIGSGKSTIARHFESHDIVVVDADAIAHQLTGPDGAAINEITRSFGAEFIGPDGAMDRAKMRELVFSQPEQRERLQAILHPLIQKETSRQADAARSAYRILMIPLLVESRITNPDWRDRFDRVLVVDCSEATQISRVMARNGLPETAIREIIAAQVPRDVRRAAADDIIDNDADASLLPERVTALHRRYMALARERSAVSPSAS